MAGWLEFAAAAVAILLVGERLSSYADALAERTGVSRGFIGVVLLGGVTSLPELITTMASISLVESADLAVGNVFGSNLFNVLILALMDFLYRERTFDSGNVLTAVLASLVALIVVVALLFPGAGGAIGHLSTFSVVIAVTYAGAMWLLYSHDKGEDHSDEGDESRGMSLGRIAVGTFLSAGVVVGAGVVATHAVDRIAEQHGLSESFAGGLFLAAATSLPEFVVSLSALRLGATSMAAGNIFGSCLFNLAILPIADMMLPANLYVGVQPRPHLVLAIGGLILTCLALSGILLGKRRPTIAGRFGLESIGIVVVYLLALSLNYTLG